MYSLAESDDKKKAAFRDTLRQALSEAEESFHAYREAAEAYNGILQDVEAWRDAHVTAMEACEDVQTELDEDWAHGYAGSTFTAWREAWYDLDLEELDVGDEPGATTIDSLDELPMAPGE